ncbi:PEP-CTERM sorting domain-containing protein [Sphingosinicellaceae bacterium]|nr:PEP-CTERM sorting domain-containing protein [Sphingosinicellaceae bacterium]
MNWHPLAFPVALSMALATAAPAMATYNFTISGPGGNFFWQMPATITANDPQGTIVFSKVAPGTNPYANLATGTFGNPLSTGTQIGLGGPNQPYAAFADTGVPIFTYVGPLSTWGRPGNATFKLGTYQVQSNYGGTLNTFTVAVPEPGAWILMIAGFVAVGVAKRRPAVMTA